MAHRAMSSFPVKFRWNGVGMVPLPGHATKMCQKQFVPGNIYFLHEVTERSTVSHDQQFAWLNDAWKTLPDHLAEEFPTPMHLRKRALIDCGFYHETIIDVGTKAGALRVAAYIQGEDQFAYVVVRGPLVVKRVAKSQRMHGHDRMLKDEFQRSKQAILEHISALLGVTPETLMA